MKPAQHSTVIRKRKGLNREIPAGLVLWGLSLAGAAMFVWGFGGISKTVEGISSGGSQALAYSKEDLRQLKNSIPEGDDKITAAVKAKRAEMGRKFAARLLGPAGNRR